VRCALCERPESRSLRWLGSWGVNEGTLANWVNKGVDARLPGNGGVSESEREALARPRL
jgi:hypothetical protein